MRLYAVLFLFITALPYFTAAQDVSGNIGHTRHQFKHGGKQATVKPDDARFTTNRKSDIELQLTKPEDSFTFVILGDRVSGEDSHVSVLADAVREINLFEPDIVMNIGDMVQGYNTTDLWLKQNVEYKGIMNELKCPWFPTSGNHDIYWGGPGKPKYQHETDFEKHFGPLWYAFEHKNNWFIVLFTDEGNRDTGEKNFSKPEMQKITEEQFQWLKATLQKAKDAEHIFVFQHQPRWQNPKNYGDDWEKVHKLFTQNGNVAAVFAGHTHQMRYEKRDGIEYFTLSTTGGRYNEAGIPKIGYQDNYYVLNVRKNKFDAVSVPVRQVIDPRVITPAVSSELAKLQSLKYSVTNPGIVLPADGKVDTTTMYEFTNTTSVPVNVSAVLTSADSRWEISTYPQTAALKPGEKKNFEFSICRNADTVDGAFRLLTMKLDITAHIPGMEVPIPAVNITVPLNWDASLKQQRIQEQAVLKLAVPEDYAETPAVKLAAEKPFTVETQFRAMSAKGTQVLLSKGRAKDETALYLTDGSPRFKIPVDETVVAASAEVKAVPGTWHHIAGVFDGQEAKLYFDGKLVGAKKLNKPLAAHNEPVILGASFNRDNDLQYGFAGAIDDVRVSGTVRYTGEFKPERDYTTDKDTLLLLDMQQTVGRYIAVPGRTYQFGELKGDSRIVPERTLN
ncbi:MAG: metallophosphoesterase [Planctomycetaceae bacterium]|jgi:3',5'-cyclic AMP phosphodiesterase CpdA|nr:metallophosphoesterase [Planctomycetaceae bacterium]